jgi:serine/threonine protein phosphatase PrpC
MTESQTRIGGLAVSRALGDHFLKNEKLGVIAVPHVSSAIELNPASPAIVILASDGVHFSFIELSCSFTCCCSCGM